MEVQSDFTKERDKVAENLYRALINNYHPVPQDLLDEKDMIKAIIEDAWVNGANWGQMKHLRGKYDIPISR